MSSENESKERFVKGRNWGKYKIDNSKIKLTGDNKPWFDIPLNSISNIQHTKGKHEVIIEFNQEEENLDTALCELRLYLPENEQEKEKIKEKKKKDDKNSKSGEEEEQSQDEENEEEEEEKSKALLLKEEITKLANIGTVSDYIAHIPDIQMVIPRSKFDLYFMENYIKIHGQSHNYKILNKNIIKVFLVPKTDGHNHLLILKLQSPLTQGNTNYPFLIFQIKSDQEETIDLNLSKNSEISEKLENPLEGKLMDILSKLFMYIVNIGIILPSKNFNFLNGPFIKCSYKANEGILFPLEKSLLFGNKPVLHINHEEIKEVISDRVSADGMKQKSFDMTIDTKNGKYQFINVDQREFQMIENYFKTKKIKFSVVDEGGQNVHVENYTTRKRATVTEDLPELPSEDELGDDDYAEESDEDEGEDDDDEEEEEESNKKKKDKKGSEKKKSNKKKKKGSENNDKDEEE